MKTLLVVLLACVLFAVPAFATPPSTHGVSWAWVNPTNVTPTSNTLYCGTVSGTYTFFWFFPVAVQSFDWLTTDTTNPPTQGTKYYCAVTAGAAGIESGYSSEVSVTFPKVPLAPTGLSATPH